MARPDLTNVVDFGKLKERDPNSIKIGYPDVTEKRFESLRANYESVTKYKNTKQATTFKTISGRRELWGDPTPQPEPRRFNIERVRGRAQGNLKFSSNRVGHDLTPKRSACATDLYDMSNLGRGFEKTTSFKKAPAMVNMAN